MTYTTKRAACFAIIAILFVATIAAAMHYYRVSQSNAHLAEFNRATYSNNR